MRRIHEHPLRTLLSLLLLAMLAVQPATGDDALDIVYSSDGGGSIETIDGVRVTTLRGNVHIRQGNSRLWGDEATLEQDPVSGEMIRARVRGFPARFEYQSDDDAELIEGHSERIDYFTAAQNGEVHTIIEFSGDASFNRGRTALQCAEISHTLETGATSSPGPCSGVLAPQDQ